MKELNNIIKWVDALESGWYKHGKDRLGDAEHGYCCLGVGCVAVGIKVKRYAAMSPTFARSVGLMDTEGHFIKSDDWYFQHRCLTDINDHTKAGFKRIAKLIKNHPEWLFQPKVAQAVKEHYS